MSTLKLFISFSFILFLLHSNAQEKKMKQYVKKFSFGLIFSPDYVYRKFDPGSGLDVWDDIEKARLGYTTGIFGNYKISNSVTLETGLMLADKGQKLADHYEDWITPEELIDPGFSGHDPALPARFEAKEHYYYLEIPLKVNYYFFDQRLRMYLSAGVSADFFLDAEVKAKYYINGNMEKVDFSEDDLSYKKINFAGLAGFGADYPLSRHIYFRLEPLLRYTFTTAVNHVPAKRYWYSFGANFSVFYQK